MLVLRSCLQNICSFDLIQSFDMHLFTANLTQNKEETSVVYKMYLL